MYDKALLDYYFSKARELWPAVDGDTLVMCYAEAGWKRTMRRAWDAPPSAHNDVHALEPYLGPEVTLIPREQRNGIVADYSPEANILVVVDVTLDGFVGTKVTSRPPVDSPGQKP